ncbi:HNH/ENDO VII family nuclease [Pirellulales bacterium]|nr:HNH/ENDO VII family nuclease [Pirellulales bacterium]
MHSCALQNSGAISPARRYVFRLAITIHSFSDIDAERVWDTSTHATLTFTAEDLDGGPPPVTIDQLDGFDVPPGVTLQQDTQNLESWSLDYAADPSHVDGIYPIAVAASDGSASTAVIIYAKIGSPPSAPTIDGTSNNTTDGVTKTGDFVYEVDEHKLLEFDVDVTADPTAGLTYSLVPSAPTGATIDELTGRFSWTPGEDEDGLIDIEIRVSDDAPAPRRAFKVVSVTVNEDDAAPDVTPGSLKLRRDTVGPNGTDDDGITSDPALVGVVTDDVSVEHAEIEVDFDYDSTDQTSFVADTIVLVDVSEEDPTRGTFVIEPSLTLLTSGVATTVGVRARQWDSVAGAYFYSDPLNVDHIEVIEYTYDETANGPPNIIDDLGDDDRLRLLNDTGIPDDEKTVDPTIAGRVENDGPTHDLPVKIYSDALLTNLIGETTTNGSGRFEFIPPGLLDNLGPGEDFAYVSVWVVAEEPVVATSTSQDSVASVPASLSFDLYEYVPPTVDLLELSYDTGATVDVTGNPQLEGAIIAGDTGDAGDIGGVTVEFSTSNAFDENEAITITEEDGSFTYLPIGLMPSDTPVTIYARPVVWDSYAHRRLEGPTNSVTFTYKETENTPAAVTSLVLTYDQDGDGVVVNPTLEGAVVNDDGPVEGILVEIVVVESGDPAPSTDETDITLVTGFAIADENGRFEFTPLDLAADVAYTAYARAAEWDGAQGQLLGQTNIPWTQISGITGPDQNFSLTSDTTDLALLEDFTLRYDTGGDPGDESDFTTADPTVSGTVIYAGDMDDVVVEIDFNSTGAVGEAAEVYPDELGYFEFTPPGLSPGQIFVNARVRIPDYSIRAPELTNWLLTPDDDGVLDAGWYLQGYAFDQVNAWDETDADGNGVADLSEQWLDDLFSADGVTLEGEWYESEFERDWSDLFQDYVTDWTPAGLAVGQEEPPDIHMDLAENAAPTFALPPAHLSGADAANPTVSGQLANDGSVAGLRIELSFDSQWAVVEGETETDDNGYFTYTFSRPDQGINDYYVRIHEPQYLGDPIVTTDPTTHTITVQNDPALGVVDLRLKNETAPGQAIDPTVVGSIVGLSDPVLQTVELDMDGDGRPDASALTDGLGRFEFTLEGFGSGAMSVLARLVEDRIETIGGVDYDYSAVGPWTAALSWTGIANAPPEISYMELDRDTGFQASDHETVDRVTSDPTIVGRVSDDNEFAHVAVEFDHDGDDLADGTSVTDADGYFTYVPSGLTVGHWDIRARVDQYDPATATTLTTDWLHMTASGTPSTDTQPAPGEFFGFVLTAATPAVISSLTLPAGAAVDPTIEGVVTDVDSTENVVVDIYRIPPGQNEVLIGSTSVDRDGSFEYLPIGLPFGVHTIEARARETDYLTGGVLSGGVASDSIDFVAISPASDLEIATPAPSVVVGDDFFTITVSGEVNNNASVVAPQFVEVNLDGTVKIAHVEPYIPDSASSNIDYRFTLDHDLRESNPSEIKVRPVGVDAQGFVFGAEVTVPGTPFTVPSVSIADSGVDAWAVDGQDGSAVTPSLTGTILATDMPAANAPTFDYSVELDYDGDEVADETVILDDLASSDFSVELDGLTSGAVDFFARAVVLVTTRVVAEGTTGNGEVETDVVQQIDGAWQRIAFEYVAPTPTIDAAGLQLPNLRSGDPHDPNDPAITSDPTVTGAVASPLLVDSTGTETISTVGMTVEVDHDGDDIVDGTTFAGENGEFEYAAAGLVPGPVTLRFRAVDYFSAPQDMTGEWASIAFTYDSLLPPTVAGIGLQHYQLEDVGESSMHSSANPLLVGSAAIAEGAGQLIVEFDFRYDTNQDGVLDLNDAPFDGVVDGSAATDVFGDYRFSPDRLAYGEIEVRARGVLITGVGRVAGAWSDELAQGAFTYRFFHDSAELAVISDFAVDDDIGTISGRVTVDGFGEATRVEVAVIQGTDYLSNGVVASNSNGQFTYLLRELLNGAYTIGVRGLVDDPNTGGKIPGPWRDQAVTIDNQEAAVLPSLLTFGLAHDTGPDSGNDVTSDPTVSGTLDGYFPQLYVTLDFSSSGGNIVDVPVLPDGTFSYAPALADFDDALPYVVSAQTKIWDYVNQYQYGPVNELLPVSATLDPAENQAPTILQLDLLHNSAAPGGTQQSADPAFTGVVGNDGALGGIVVRFDHNGDGLIDGETLTGADGSFLYEAANLEPSVATQTITAYAAETNFWRTETTGPTFSLDFILTYAPLVRDLTHDSANRKITGGVFSDSNDLIVEYELFGNGATQPSPPTDLQDYQQNGAGSGSLQQASVDAGGNFEFSTATLQNGAAAAIVRSLDVTVPAAPVIGPWQTIHFTAGEVASTAWDLSNFQLVVPGGAVAEQTSDTRVTGRLGPEIPGGADGEGAFGVVELKVREQGSTQTLAVYRATAGGDGWFEFNVPYLSQGVTYTIEARSVGFDGQTQSETFGLPETLDITPQANQIASVVNFELADPNQSPVTDPALTGAVVNPDGRINGLRVEFYDSDQDPEAAPIGFAFTDGNGDFTYTPYGLAAGAQATDTTNIEIWARVSDWDQFQREYVKSDFTEDAKVAFSLTGPGPDAPTFDEDVAEKLATLDRTEESLRDVVFSMFGAIYEEDNVPVGYEQTGRIGLGMGDMLLLHRGRNDAVEGGDALFHLNDYYFLFAENDRGATGQLTGVAGQANATFDVDYYNFQFDLENVISNMFTLAVDLEIQFSNYRLIDSAEGDEGVISSDLALSGSYDFSFSAVVYHNGDSSVAVDMTGVYDVSEEVTDLEYVLINETAAADDGNGQSAGQLGTVTAAGDLNYHYQAEDATFQTSEGSVEEDFTYTETVHLDTWFTDSGTEVTERDGRTTTRTWSITEHTVYAETTTTVPSTTGAADYANGEQSYGGKLVVDAAGTFDSQRNETISYVENYEGSAGYEQGSDAITEGRHYEASLYLTDNYDSGLQTFNFTEDSIATASQSGNGVTHTAGSSNNRTATESWHYSASGTATAGLTAAGTASEEDGPAGERVETLDASVSTNYSASQNASGGGSFTYSSSDGDGNSDSGSGSANFSLSAHGSLNQRATIQRVGDVYLVAGGASGSYGASGSESASGSGVSVTGSDTETVVRASYASRQGASATASGSAQVDFTSTNEGSKTSGTFTSSLGAQASIGDHVSGTITTTVADETEVTPFRNNEATTLSLGVSNNGKFANDQLGDEHSLTIDGSARRNENTTTKATSFASAGANVYVGGDQELCTYGPTDCDDSPGIVRVADGSSQLSLVKTSSAVTSSEDYDYSYDDGELTRRGNFDEQRKSSRETIDQIAAAGDTENGDGAFKYYHRSETGGRATSDVGGNFRDSTGGDQGAKSSVSGDLDQTSAGYSAETTRLSLSHDDGQGNRSASTSFDHSKGRGTTDGQGAVSLKGGAIQRSSGQGQANTAGRTNYGGNDFNESTSSTQDGGNVNSTFHVVSRSSGDARGNNAANSESSGGSSGGSPGGNQTNGFISPDDLAPGPIGGRADVDGSQSGRVRGNGSSSTESVQRTFDGANDRTSTDATKTYSRGNSGGRSHGKGDGNVDLDRGQSDFDVESNQSGNTGGKTIQTTVHFSPEVARTGTAERTDSASGGQGFEGNVSTEDGTTGNLTLDSENKTGGAFFAREHTSSAGLPSVWTVEGDSDARVDLAGSQQLVDHDSVEPPPNVTVTRNGDGAVVTKGRTESGSQLPGEEDGWTQSEDYERTQSSRENRPKSGDLELFAEDVVTVTTIKKSRYDDDTTEYTSIWTSSQKTDGDDEHATSTETISLTIDSLEIDVLESGDPGYSIGIGEKRHEVVQRDAFTRTFTASGASRNLDIEASNLRTVTDTDVYPNGDGALPGGPNFPNNSTIFLEQPADSGGQETTDASSFEYHASHNVGPDGELVTGGTLTAESAARHREAAFGNYTTERELGPPPQGSSTIPGHSGPFTVSLYFYTESFETVNESASYHDSATGERNHSGKYQRTTGTATRTDPEKSYVEDDLQVYYVVNGDWELSFEDWSKKTAEFDVTRSETYEGRYGGGKPSAEWLSSRTDRSDHKITTDINQVAIGSWSAFGPFTWNWEVDRFADGSQTGRRWLDDGVYDSVLPTGPRGVHEDQSLDTQPTGTPPFDIDNIEYPEGGEGLFWRALIAGVQAPNADLNLTIDISDPLVLQGMLDQAARDAERESQLVGQSMPVTPPGDVQLTLDDAQMLADGVGLTEGPQAVVGDLVSAGISAYKGEIGVAALTVGSALPFLGKFFDAIKYSRKVDNIVGGSVKLGDDVAEELVEKSSRGFAAPKKVDAPKSNLWNKSKNFDGNKVFQRDDLIDPSLIDSRGRSNLERMKKGLAPLGPDGKSINLHHTIQTQGGAIAEVSQTFHQQNSKIIHINPNSTPSGIDRGLFDKWKRDYWKDRANDFGD